MSASYIVSLATVTAVAMLLCSTLLVQQTKQRGLTAYCGAVACSSAILLLAMWPPSSDFSGQFVQVGAFVPPAFLHASFDLTGQRHRALVWLGYLAGLAIFVVGIVWPDFIVHPASLRGGPAFWPSMGLAISATAVPLVRLLAEFRGADPVRRRQLWVLTSSGLLGFCGAGLNVLAIAHGRLVPLFPLSILASLLLFAALVRSHSPHTGRRLIDRSIFDTAVSASFVAGVAAVVLVGLHRLGQLSLSIDTWVMAYATFLVALALEPLRRRLQRASLRRLLPGHLDSEQLDLALQVHEGRADHQKRLAELGRVVSAVAHEIRNPLGVISAHNALIQRQLEDPSSCREIRGQIQRAEKFLGELQRYGKPRALKLEVVEARELIEVSARHAWTSFRTQKGSSDPEDAPFLGLEQLPMVMLECDRDQIMQVLIILFDNALRALGEAEPSETAAILVQSQATNDRLRIEVHDDGPGIPEAIRTTLFDAFVSRRGRAAGGTGLGLAIARSIAHRHAGRLELCPPERQGAAFRLELPLVPPTLTSTPTAP